MNFFSQSIAGCTFKDNNGQVSTKIVMVLMKKNVIIAITDLVTSV